MLGVIYARDFRDEVNGTKWLKHAASLGVQEALPALRIYFPAKKH
jgi:TPR repeat protein